MHPLAILAFLLAAVGTSALNCTQYCSTMTVDAGPPDGNSSYIACPEVYPTMGAIPSTTVCEAICSLWALGNEDVSSTTTGNTVTCRQHYALIAQSYALNYEDDEDCPIGGGATMKCGQLRQMNCGFASPLGGAPPIGYKCGNLIDFYCDTTLAGSPNSTFTFKDLALCLESGYANHEECYTDVEATVTIANITLNLNAPVFTGDNLECRASYAALALNPSGVADDLCPQSYWYGTTINGTAGCNAPGSTTGVCDSFCNSYDRVCGYGPTGAVETGYADLDDCKAKCAAFRFNDTRMRLGDEPSDIDGPGCRKYHIVLAQVNKDDAAAFALHCGHATADSPICKATPDAAYGVAPVAALVMALIAFATRM